MTYPVVKYASTRCCIPRIGDLIVGGLTTGWLDTKKEKSVS